MVALPDKRKHILHHLSVSAFSRTDPVCSHTAHRLWWLEEGGYSVPGSGRAGAWRGEEEKRRRDCITT